MKQTEVDETPTKAKKPTSTDLADSNEEAAPKEVIRTRQGALGPQPEKRQTADLTGKEVAAKINEKALERQKVRKAGGVWKRRENKTEEAKVSLRPRPPWQQARQ